MTKRIEATPGAHCRCSCACWPYAVFIFDSYLVVHLARAHGLTHHHGRARLGVPAGHADLLTGVHECTALSHGSSEHHGVLSAVGHALRHSLHGLGHAELGAGGVLSLELGAADLLALGQGHVERLRVQHASVHGRDGLGCLLGRGEAHEAEALALAGGVTHDLGRGDRAVLGELGGQLVVISLTEQGKKSAHNKNEATVSMTS